MLRCPEIERIYKIKFIISFLTLFSVFELFNDKIDHIKEKLLLPLSIRLNDDFF